MAKNTLYEMLYIIDSSIGDEQVKRYQEEMKKVITDNGGEISKESNWGNRKLAYEIRKKTEGNYINLEFLAPPEVPHEINQYVNTHYVILRHLCLVVPKAKLTQERLDAEKEKKQLEEAKKEREEFLRRQREAEEREKAAAAAKEQPAETSTPEEPAATQPSETSAPSSTEEQPKQAETTEQPVSSETESTGEEKPQE